MNKTLLLLLLILTSSLAACSTKPPPDLIPKEKFAQIMADMELNRAYYQASKDTASADSVRRKLLSHYGITEVQYLKTREYYQKTGQEHEIIKKALDKLNHEKDKIYNYIKQKTDTTHQKQKPQKEDTTAKSEKHPDHRKNP